MLLSTSVILGQDFLGLVIQLGKLYTGIKADCITVSRYRGSRDGAVARALASHQCGLCSIPGCGVMWVEFVVGSCRCTESFFSGYSGFLPLLKNQFYLDYQPLYHEPLAQEFSIAFPILLTVVMEVD